VSPEPRDLIAGRYRRLGTVGVGGMARVVLARDERLGRRVAIKALHADSPEDTARRFEREARMGASLNHPNLVSVYDVVTDRETVLIVMEYVEGRTLKESIADGPLSGAAVTSTIGDVAAALDHAHGHGIVHRDVKPANILIRDDGVTKLADLGIATAAESTRITRSGVVLGTAVYMAPEQLEGHEAGPAADVYSLAAVAFEALSGRRAREGATPVELAHRAATGPPPDLVEAWPAAPPEAARVLARGMDRDPARRPRSAGELAAELQRALAAPATAPIGAADPTLRMERTRAPARRPAPDPVPPALPRVRRGRRFPAWLPAAAALLLLCAAGAVALASIGGPEDETGQSGRASGQGAGAERTPARTGGRARAEEPAPAAPQPAPAPVEDPAPEEPAEEVPIDPEEGARLDAQAYGLIQQGRYAEAVPIARRAVASFPEDDTSANYAYALFNLGTALNRSGSPEEAIPYLEKRLSFSDDRREIVQAELDDARANAGA